jgi:hypothetical protein
MNKRNILISLGIILLSAIIMVTITLIYVFNYDEYHVEDLNVVSYGYREKDAVTLHLGKYKVKNIYNTLNDNGEKYKLDFNVKSGEDFYNKIIKENDAYVSELDYKELAEQCISIGYMVLDNNIFYYEVWSDGAHFEPCYGDVSLSFIYQYDGNDLASDIYLLGDFSSILTEDRLQTEPSDYEYHYRQVSWSWYFNITYNDYIKIYNYIDEDICKIEDDIVYLKGIFLDKDGNKHLTNNYYVTISNVDGTPTLSLI